MSAQRFDDILLMIWKLSSMLMKISENLMRFAERKLKKED